MTLVSPGGAETPPRLRDIDATEYAQLMYVLNHHSLIKAAPLIALFLYADQYFVYSVQHAKFKLLLYQHYDLSETEYL